MATTHETEHGGGGHPSLKQYIVIAIMLFAITIVEFVIIMDFPGEAEKVIADALGEPATTILLFLLSGIKFAIVILFYMHLKFDNRFFFWVFIAGMVLAVMVGLALIGLFAAIKGGDLRADDAPYVQCAFDHELGAHGENVCPTPVPQPTSTPHPVVPTIVYTAPVAAAPCRSGGWRAAERAGCRIRRAAVHAVRLQRMPHDGRDFPDGAHVAGAVWIPGRIG